MFPAFQSTIVVNREYVEDLGPMMFPWIKFTTALDEMRHCYTYVFLPILPLAWVWLWYSRLEGRTRYFVSRRWFRNGYLLDGFYEDRYPANECVPEGEYSRWRGMSIYLWRRTSRVLKEMIDR